MTTIDPQESSDRSQPHKALRQHAEEMARTSPTDIAGMTSNEVQRLIHELQIHQIELELQNEELRLAQVELAHSHDQYSDLYEFAPTGYVTLDSDGKIQNANLTAAAMLGVERQHLLQAKLSNLQYWQSFMSVAPRAATLAASQAFQLREPRIAGPVLSAPAGGALQRNKADLRSANERG